MKRKPPSQADCTLYSLFYRACCGARGRRIDPNEEQDYYPMSLGFALAKGYTPGQAHAFAIWARDTKEYKDPAYERAEPGTPPGLRRSKGSL